jgi:hypothetical protein
VLLIRLRFFPCIFSMNELWWYSGSFPLTLALPVTAPASPKAPTFGTLPPASMQSSPRKKGGEGILYREFVEEG